MHRIESCHDHATLALPHVAIGTEHPSGHTHLGPNFFQARRSAVTIRAVTQHRSDLLMVPNDHDFALEQLQLVNGTVLAAPLFKLQVGTGCVDLQRVTKVRNATGSGQVVKRAHGLRCRFL